MPSGVYPRLVGVHRTAFGLKMTSEEAREHRIARSRRYRTEDPARWREMKRKFLADRRARVDALKTGPCTDCGQTFPPECMDFDHVRGEKFSDVGKMYDYSEELLKAEIAKCELVCANCHRTRTKNRRKK